MTELTTPDADVIRANLRELIAFRGNQVKAAQAWDMDQTMLSKILGGTRSPDPWLKQIAEKEGIPLGWFRTPRHAGAPASSVRFKFSVEDPIQMSLQLEEFFAEVPEGKAPFLVKAVMRAMLDQFFGAVHQPDERWRFVMNRVEGFATGLHKPQQHAG